MPLKINRKEDILVSLSLIPRPGIKELMTFLCESDYFTAPSSTQFHCNYEGGLAEHSWNVFDLLAKKCEQYSLPYDYETLAIVGLLHDLCKVNFYKFSDEDPSDAQINYLMKLCNRKLPPMPGKLNKDYASKLIGWYKDGAKGDQPPYSAGQWIIDDQLPLGHGEKSVIIAQQYIKLLEHEMLAIRWHMSAFDPGINFNFPTGYPFRAAADKSPLVHLLFMADYEASNIVEAMEK